MKPLLVIATLLLAWPAQQAAAQQGPPTPQATAERPAPVDSAAVLHQLFKHSRRFASLGVVASSGIASGTTNLRDPRRGHQILGGLVVGIDIGLLVVIWTNQVKFSRCREREAIEQLHHQQPLRPYVQRNYALALAKATLPRR
ncbi:hypothetical protein A0257_18730 [Hymenobacter psoromatis]|nr:hypothetical protein A0257_18730 [Hymenobacter psoromatis]